MRRRYLLLPLAVAAGLAAERAGYGWGDPGHWIPDLAVGWCLIGGGFIAAARRPETWRPETWRLQGSPGVLMTVTGFTWFLGNFAGAGQPVVAWTAAHALYLHRGPLFQLLLSYPGSRRPSRVTIAAIVAGYAAAIITPVWHSDAATILLATLLSGGCGYAYARAVGPDRRARLIALQAAAGLSLVLGAIAVVDLVIAPADVSAASLLAYEVAVVTVAGVLLAGLLLGPVEGAAVTDLVLQLGQARSVTLRGELARAIGDPTLEIGYWLAGTGVFVDADGGPLALPGDNPDRSATVVERDGHPAAVLIHDPAVLGDQGLLDAVAAAAQLESANARLRAEVRAQIAELEASRRRILEAGDQARQRLERRLHDGAERRLAALRETLDRGRRGAAGQQTADLIARGEDQLTRAVQELRQLALGLHPRALSEHGLAGALARLADGSPVPVEITVTASRMSAPAQAATYFVCSEGLANVAKYAMASRAAISVTAGDGTVVIAVSDDGAGGADPGQGSGLTGLADRVETLGGTFRVNSAPGRGTRLTAEIPLGGQER
jgi:signal transduction histidine kinase